MEKYGFVYIWYDVKRKMYYIGSHWGTEDDGYICSSNRMRDAYRRRPKDFKRRIISRVDTNREELLNEEHRLLEMIPDKELGKKYYNYRKHRFGHWTSDKELSKDVKKTISEKTKEAMWRPDVREKYLNAMENRDTSWLTDEIREKKRQSMIDAWEKKSPKENRKVVLRHDSDELKELHRKNTTEIWSKRTKEELKEVGSKISSGLKGKQNRLGQTNTQEHNNKISEAIKNSEKTGRTIMVNGIKYRNIKHAERNLDVSYSTICRRLKSTKHTEWYYLQ